MRVFAVLCACLVCVCLLCVPVSAETAPSVSAASAVLYEPQSGVVLFAKNAFEHRAIASTTKLMTALLAAESGDLSRCVTVPAAAVHVEGTSMGLLGGDCISMHDLVAGALLASGNDAANAIAMAVGGSLPGFAERMNERAASLGMKSAVFVTPSGLDEGAHGASAYDMALLAAAVLQNEELSRICAAKSLRVTVNGQARTLYNHNKLLSLYDGCVGMKTGFTKKAGRCLVSAAERNGVTLIAVTLNAPNDWDDHATLLDFGFSQVRSAEPDVDAPPSLPLIGGVEESVSITAEIPRFTVPVWDRVAGKLAVGTPLWAPVQAGDTVGEMQFFNSEGALLGAVPVTVRKSVAARAPLPRYVWFWRYFKGLFARILE